MARGVDASKRRLWAERLRRFERGDWTVSGFCEAEGVSDASFYQWRKKLRGMQESAAAARQLAEQLSVKGSRGTFVPLQIVPAATIAIHLPNGARVTLPAGDLAALEATLAAVGRLPAAVRGEAV